mmetsp:Transcript_11386/g.34072  ORF Transcript_11386/g.34072 Transcript_11386/m.34072 type:complete len:207 (+) Transcript_11386:145-765(+)
MIQKGTPRAGDSRRRSWWLLSVAAGFLSLRYRTPATRGVVAGTSRRLLSEVDVRVLSRVRARLLSHVLVRFLRFLGVHVDLRLVINVLARLVSRLLTDVRCVVKERVDGLSESASRRFSCDWCVVVLVVVAESRRRRRIVVVSRRLFHCFVSGRCFVVGRVVLPECGGLAGQRSDVSCGRLVVEERVVDNGLVVCDRGSVVSGRAI